MLLFNHFAAPQDCGTLVYIFLCRCFMVVYLFAVCLWDCGCFFFLGKHDCRNILRKRENMDTFLNESYAL